MHRYQLKSKRGNGKPFIELPIEEREQQANGKVVPKKLKRMKKKLGELNRKIRHSRKRHEGMIHKRNALRKVIEGLKGPTSGDSKSLSGILKELNRTFRGAYRSYRIRGYPRMDVETFLQRIWEKLIKLIGPELTVLRSFRTQMTMWVRFIKDDER